MTEIEAAAPTFTHLLKSEAVPSSDRIDVYFGADDRSGYKLEFAAKIVPALMLEFRGRMEQLRPGEADSVMTTAVKPHGIKVAVGARGTPALLISMGGYDLALELTQEAVAVLHAGTGQLLRPN